MSRLFKLKEWLTLDEAAAHISNVLGEPASIADLYRFALDGHLTLSVDFVNHAQAQKGKWVKTEDVEFNIIEEDPSTGEKLGIPFASPKNHEISVTEDDWILLDNPVSSIHGIWDLTMIGDEKLDIEHNYQQLTSGLEVNLVTLAGAFVQQGDVVCQLQESFENNEFQEGSNAYEKEMENRIANNDISDDEAKKLRAKFKEDRNKFLRDNKGNLKEIGYYPAGGLPEDCVLVIRTNEITKFIQSLEDDTVSEKPLTSKERNSLLVLIGALCKELDIDPNQRGVATSLVAMTDLLGAPLTDDTIRKILKQIEEAVELRTK